MQSTAVHWSILISYADPLMTTEVFQKVIKEKRGRILWGLLQEAGLPKKCVRVYEHKVIDGAGYHGFWMCFLVPVEGEIIWIQPRPATASKQIVIFRLYFKPINDKAKSTITLHSLIAALLIFFIYLNSVYVYSTRLKPPRKTTNLPYCLKVSIWWIFKVSFDPYFCFLLAKAVFIV